MEDFPIKGFSIKLDLDELAFQFGEAGNIPVEMGNLPIRGYLSGENFPCQEVIDPLRTKRSRVPLSGTFLQIRENLQPGLVLQP